MGAELKSKRHLQNRFFGLLSLFQRACGLKVFKKFFVEKIKKISKNAEFHTDFESVEKVVKKCTKKKLSAKLV